MYYSHDVEPPPHLHAQPCEGIYVTRSNTTGAFLTLDELFSRLSDAEFADITALSLRNMPQVNHHAYVGTIEKLPPNLQSLDVRDCNGFKKFPTCIPPSIHTIHIVNTRVGDIPDLSRLVNLELLNMHGSNVYAVDRPLPASLRTLILDHNRLRTIDYDLLPPGLAKLSVHHNSLSVSPPAHLTADVDFHGNATMDQRRFVDHVLEKQKATNLYEHTQNVHDSTIQGSVRKSIDLLFKMHASEQAPKGYVDLLKARVRSIAEKKRKESSDNVHHNVDFELERNKFFSTYGGEIDPLLFLHAMVEIPTTIGTTGKTLGGLLERAYVVASKHVDSDELFERLGQELVEGHLMCFTGKISRIVNAFVGFVDGIALEISPRAELHARINAILIRKQKSFNEDTNAKIYEEFLGIISTHCDMADPEFDAWLDAFHEV